jgi:adenosylmethionine-8-amino-7-oxononanoate aminotransferase
MRLLRDHRILEELPAREAALARALGPLAAHPHVGEIRRRGLMVGIELVRDRGTKEEYAFALRAGHQVTLEARRRGAILRPLGNVVVLMPPLAMTGAQLGELGRITVESIDAAVARL